MIENDSAGGLEYIILPLGNIHHRFNRSPSSSLLIGGPTFIVLCDSIWECDCIIKVQSDRDRGGGG